MRTLIIALALVIAGPANAGCVLNAARAKTLYDVAAASRVCPELRGADETTILQLGILTEIIDKTEADKSWCLSEIMTGVYTSKAEMARWSAASRAKYCAHIKRSLTLNPEVEHIYKNVLKIVK